MSSCGSLNDQEVEAPYSSRMYLRSAIRHMRQRVHISLLIDSGSRPSILGYGAYLRLGKRRPHLKKYDPEIHGKLEGPSGEHLEVVGIADLWVKFGDREEWISFKVVNNLLTSATIL